MNPEKTIIAKAVSDCPLTSRPEWKSVAAAAGDAEVERIEADCSTITTVDCLFDGEATIHLSDDRALYATVFGRFDSQRAEIDRVVFECEERPRVRANGQHSAPETATAATTARGGTTTVTKIGTKTGAGDRDEPAGQPESKPEGLHRRRGQPRRH